jgi:hypothetical protein
MSNPELLNLVKYYFFHSQYLFPVVISPLFLHFPLLMGFIYEIETGCCEIVKKKECLSDQTNLLKINEINVKRGVV